MNRERATIGVFGAGYVGLVTGACLAELGHSVVVRDIVPGRIEGLRAGEVPIYEPGLAELLERNHERLRFTLDVAEAIEGADFLYICVGTPPTYSGDADLSDVWTVIDELLPTQTRATVVMKSTVPVGTGEKVRAALDARGLEHVGYVSNPEFTAEGTAVRDFLHPDRIVIGAFDEADAEAVASLHEGIEGPIVRCDVASAEMVKLASNAFLMTRVSFINEIANVCEATGADVEQVARGIGLDHRLGPHFLRAGIGYGGSCLAGEESVLVRSAGTVRLLTLESLFRELTDDHDAEIAFPEGLEVLSWRENAETPEFFPIAAATRRTYRGDILEVRTKMGRRVRCTPDHPFVVGSSNAGELEVREAAQLTTNDWLPVAQRAPKAEIEQTTRLNVLESLGAAEATPSDVTVRPDPAELSAHGAKGVRGGIAHLEHPSEATALKLRLHGAVLGPARNGTYIPASLEADEAFWRVVGLYIAEGHCSADGRRRRMQRLPDLIWTAPATHKRALLSGLWHGDGSWSYVARGPSVVLEYGTVSRELADGILRLLGELGIVARLKVGRAAKSTRDSYWLIVAGADQVERMLDVVPEHLRAAIQASLARQTKRIAPTGYRRRSANAAWVRVADISRQPYEGSVYSLEVPDAHTFVTTGSLVVHNCFPKDSLALKQLAANSGYHFQLLNAVIEVNELQKRRVVGKLKKHLGSLRGTTIALLGLAFKPNTDDLREAPSIVLASRLLAEGAEVRAWDPVADASALLQGVIFSDSPLEAVRDADAAVIVTEWEHLRTLAGPEIREAMRNPLIVDGRNLLDPAAAREAGFVYEGIGRASSSFAALPETEEPEPASDVRR